MMRDEATSICGRELTDDEWAAVETVYMWHPCITDKATLQSLYDIGGMVILSDMLSRAELLMGKEKALTELKRQRSELEKDIQHTAEYVPFMG